MNKACIQQENTIEHSDGGKLLHPCWEKKNPEDVPRIHMDVDCGCLPPHYHYLKLVCNYLDSYVTFDKQII